MRRIVAQARKELTQIVRDWRTLALALVLPVILLALLSAALSLTVTELPRSEEHTSELQSLRHLVCRLLLENIRASQRSTLFPYTTLFRSTLALALVLPVILLALLSAALSLTVTELP